MEGDVYMYPLVETSAGLETSTLTLPASFAAKVVGTYRLQNVHKVLIAVGCGKIDRHHPWSMAYRPRTLMETVTSNFE